MYMQATRLSEQHFLEQTRILAAYITLAKRVGIKEYYNELCTKGLRK